MKRKLTYFILSIVTLFLVFVVYFFTIKHLNNEIQGSLDLLPLEKQERFNNFIIPTQFVDGERFYFILPIPGHDSIMAFGDTGGGISFLSPNAINKEGIKSNLKMGIIGGVMPIKYILYQNLVADVNFPIPNPNAKLILRNPFKRVTRPFLMIPPMDNELKLMLESQPEMNAFLGQTFFMDHSWTIDYPSEKIILNTPLDDSLLNYSNIQKLGFRKNSKQEKVNGHPSMKVQIDGDTIDVLFDTGATIVLSEDGKEQFKTDKKTLGGSFIASSIFKKWRNNHPNWKYYPKADLTRDIIEVPVVRIGEYEVGPVLFAERSYEVWSKGMISSMDKIVKGAIGGSVLKYFKITIDYNSELIRFEE